MHVQLLHPNTPAIGLFTDVDVATEPARYTGSCFTRTHRIMPQASWLGMRASCNVEGLYYCNVAGSALNLVQASMLRDRPLKL